jgi:UDP-N-acetylglucosamine acyltransferase
MSLIHPTAIVDSAACLAPDVKVGPYSIIGPNVTLASKVEVMSHVCIEGHTSIGEGTQIFPFSVIGFPPPDLKYKGEDSRLVIGKNNVIREHVTIHTGTAVDRNETTIGDNCLFMASSHVAHDCIIGSNVIMANCAALGGHVIIEDFAIIGGLSAVQQRVRIGAYSIVGGMSGIDADLIPFGRAVGDRARLAGLNTIGLKRNNIPNSRIIAMNEAFDRLFLEDYDVFEKRVSDVAKEFSDDEFIMRIINFISDEQTKTLCKPVMGETSNAA